MIEAPVRADIFKLEIPEITHGNVFFRPDRTPRHDSNGLGHAFGAHLTFHDVDVRIVRKSICDVQVEATIIVQIHQTDRPSPIGGGDSRQERRFLKITCSRIDQQGISRNLRHCCGAIRPFVEARSGIGHHTLVLLMGGGGHVGDDEIDQPVVVHVTVIRAH